MEEEKEKQLDPAITRKSTTSLSFNLSQKMEPLKGPNMYITALRPYQGQLQAADINLHMQLP